MMKQIVFFSLLMISVFVVAGCRRETAGQRPAGGMVRVRSNDGNARWIAVAGGNNVSGVSNYEAYTQLQPVARDEIPKLAEPQIVNKFGANVAPQQQGNPLVDPDEITTTKVQRQPDGSWQVHGTLGTDGIAPGRSRSNETRLPWTARAVQENGKWRLTDFELERNSRDGTKRAQCEQRKEVFAMRIAIPTFGGRVSPRFDCAETFAIVTVDETDGSLKRRDVVMTDWTPHERVKRLRELGVTTVVCNGVDCWSVESLRSAGIAVYDGIIGDTEEALKALLKGDLDRGHAVPSASAGQCGPQRFDSGNERSVSAADQTKHTHWGGKHAQRHRNRRWSAPGGSRDA